MTGAPFYTPYDGSGPLFAIGMKPLDPATWIEVDDALPAYLDEKARLERTAPDRVFRADAASAAGQAELLAMLTEHLVQRFPDIYRREGGAIDILPTGRRVLLDEGAPIQVAGRLVQEDLVLMCRDAEGWRLAAASLSFASSWALADKFGRALADIHAPVPGFGPGSGKAEMMARIFDRLPVGRPALRWNWGVHDRPDLHLHPGEGEGGRLFDDDAIFLRVERQTLRKLPVSGDIVFTIRIYVDPLARLAVHPEGRRIAEALAGQVAALDAEQLAYKGLVQGRPRLIERLRCL